MTPILFNANETLFSSNGLGRLSDASRCIVKEVRNGEYELEMDYPMDGIHFENIQEERIIYAKHDDTIDKQPFTIYKITKPINGIVTVLARHISYHLSRVVVKPFTSGSCAGALQGLVDNSLGDNPFTVWTDKSVAGDFTVKVPTAFHSLLGGVKGSILDLYGPGEYEYDKFVVYFKSRRGVDTDVVICYGKNLTDIKQVSNSAKIWTGIVPYWKGTNSNHQEVVVTLGSDVVYTSEVSNYAYKMLIPVDLSDEFDSQPTVAQLRTAAETYVANNEVSGIPASIDISFVALWQTDEYENVAPLQRLSLCDTITVRHEGLGIDTTAKITSVTYNVLTERYDKMTIGQVSTTFNKMTERISKQSVDLDDIDRIKAQTTQMQQAIDHATALITGNQGGYVMIRENANGQPEEILILDTNNIETAVNVLRMNLSGIGFSKTGYQGPFTTAWTIDGKFNADFITAGTLNANIIKAGIIADLAGKNSWNLVSGVLQTTSMTATDITATGTFASTGRGSSHFNYGTEVTIKMEGGAIVGYYNNAECGRITMASSVDYGDSGNVYYKKAMILESTEMILITTPILAVRENWYSSYRYNCGVSKTMSQAITFNFSGSFESGFSWKNGTFDIVFINGICVDYTYQY